MDMSQDESKDESHVGMKVLCAHTELADVDFLIPNPKNPNKHPENQIKLLAKIMKHQGWRSPVVVSQRSGFITKGHGRLQAARLNGWHKAPIDRQNYATEADEYADMVADNKIAELSETDLVMVNEHALELPKDFDLELLGIPDFEIVPVETLDPQCDEDEVPEHVEPKTKLGDVYQLGRHRLMCGDSTSIDAVENLMNGEKADMVFTDPPYGMAYESNAWDSTKADVKAKRTDSIILNDETTDAGKDALRLIPAVIANEAHLYVWCRWDCFPEFLEVVKEISKVKSVVVWDKGGPGLGDLACSYGDSEWAIHGLVGRKPLTERQNAVWQVNRMKGLQMVHPTQKPIELCERGIVNSTKIGETVLDLFGGSGSTLIACEKTNRKCFMMELDPKYCDVIVARWEKYTGKVAELING